MRFEILLAIVAIETIAIGRQIREYECLRRVYGPGHWRKLEGIATVRLPSLVICVAEVHWYEAHGIGRKEMKIKRIVLP